MNASAWLSVAFVAVMWGGWPLVARVAGLSSIWVAIVGTSVGAVAVLLVSGLSGQIKNLPDTKALLLGSIAGVMLGLGMFAYSKLVSNPEWEISTLVPIAAGLITTLTAIGGVLFFGESIGLAKSIGLVCVVIGIALLS